MARCYGCEKGQALPGHVYCKRCLADSERETTRLPPPPRDYYKRDRA